MKMFDEKERLGVLDRIAEISGGSKGESDAQYALGEYDEAPFNELIGKTLTNVSGAIEGNDFILFECSDGSKYTMLHFQDCCERVDIDDICGDTDRLIGNVLLRADESTSHGEDDYHDSFTWTFYHLDTVKGNVTIKWYGTSNGYYSERVTLVKIA